MDRDGRGRGGRNGGGLIQLEGSGRDSMLIIALPLTFAKYEKRAKYIISKPVWKRIGAIQRSVLFCPFIHSFMRWI